MFTPRVLRFESLPSTNLEAARQAGEGAPEGLCIVAAEQTAGRGRLERQWISPKGAGLYFSMILRPQFDQSRWAILTMLAAVAVHDTLTEVFGLAPDIKWPNDVLINDKKICGILAETVETNTGRAIVLGIGINLNASSFPSELNDVATSVEAETAQKADAEIVIEPLVNSLIRYYELLNLSGSPETLVAEWSKRSSYAMNKPVRVTNGDVTIEGVSRGLDSDGALIIETDAGEFKTVRTGDVTRLRAQ
ncbi:MAG TPA: biotin--[acetyl-CoA-carboxylase] ligase [Pyrinomonadaceae bacterium]|nr:biotin--[acetyl-CoA-carboxylase] ligase [Pyrinomonadaceae bacterium]